MNIPERIWLDPQLDVLDKLIIGIIMAGGNDKLPADIAHELQTSQKRVNQRINKMRSWGLLTVERKGRGINKRIHMEVNPW